MTASVFLIAVVIGLVPAPADCGGNGGVVRDWGLHREWLVVSDSDHPERPARLSEVCWQDPATTGRQSKKTDPTYLVEVRAGMHVKLAKQDSEVDIHLVGTALGPGRVGERVAVRAGLSGAVLHGIVRGPGLVELVPEKGPR